MKTSGFFKSLALALILSLAISCLAGCGDKKSGGAGKLFNKKNSAATSNKVSDKTDGDSSEKENADSGKTETPAAQDKELEALKKMTSKQIGEEIFEDAFKVYHLFDGGCLDHENEVTVKKGDVTYHKVKSKQSEYDSSVNFSSYQEFKDYVRRYFSKEFTEKLFKDTYYMNVDGELYTVPVGRGGNMAYLSHSFAVTSAKSGEIEYTIYLKTIKDEYIDYLFTEEDFEPTDDMITTTELKYNYKKIDGKWVFTNFQGLY